MDVSASPLFSLSENSTSSKLSPESHPYLIVSNYVRSIGYSVVLFLGCFGNAMTVTIARRMMSEDSVIEYYFIALALADTVVILRMPVDILLEAAFGIDLFNKIDAICKIVQWLTWSTTLSSWYLVCMTLHRAMSVAWPHRINVVCTPRKVLILLVVVGLLIPSLYAHYLFGYKLTYLEDYDRISCWIDSEEFLDFMENVWSYVRLMIILILPFMLILSGNVVLVWKLKKSAKDTRQTLAGGNTGQILAREKAANSVTLTVVVVSVAYFVLNLPGALYIILFHYGGTDEVDPELRWLVYNVTSVLYHINSVVNFYLYCLTGRKFRKEFLNMVNCARTKL